MLKEAAEIRERIMGLKKLTLMAPEYALRFGIPADAPVFVSPLTIDEEFCSRCGNGYDPRIYQVGALVEVRQCPHNHFNGIHFESFKSFDKFGSTGWEAVVEAIGPITYEFGIRKAQKVKILQIRAFCSGSDELSEVTHSCFMNHRDQLRRGLVFSAITTHEDYLFPLCSLEKHPNLIDRVKFRFKITENDEVLFSLL